jgi:MFS family permease
MLSIALLVHVQRLTGSYGLAGLAAGAYGLATGVGGPLLGRLADRRGQRRVLLVGATATATQLIALALLPAGAPAALLVVLAAGIGFAQPPVGACLRAALPALVVDGDAIRRAYAIESTAAELTFIAGPPIALAVSAAWSTRAALAGAGVALLGATAQFAARAGDRQADRAAAPRSRAGSLASPVIVTLSLVLAGVGFAFGATEVSVTAAAADLGSTAGAGPLLALWAVGSLAGGLLVARFGARRLGLGAVVVVLLLAHAAPALGAGGTVALAALLLLAGATIAPTYTVVYALAGDAAPEGTATEAFAWLATAVSVGAAAGAAIAGGVIDHAGPGAGFLVGGLGGLAVAAPLLRRLATPALSPEAA